MDKLQADFWKQLDLLVNKKNMEKYKNIEELEALRPNELLSVGGGMILTVRFVQPMANFFVGFGEGLREGFNIARQSWS